MVRTSDLSCPLACSTSDSELWGHESMLAMKAARTSLKTRKVASILAALGKVEMTCRRRETTRHARVDTRLIPCMTGGPRGFRVTAVEVAARVFDEKVGVAGACRVYLLHTWRSDASTFAPSSE